MFGSLHISHLYIFNSQGKTSMVLKLDYPTLLDDLTSFDINVHPVFCRPAIQEIDPSLDPFTHIWMTPILGQASHKCYILYNPGVFNTTYVSK